MNELIHLFIVERYFESLEAYFSCKLSPIYSLKVGLSPSKKSCVIYFIESPLKMIKNAFYFILFQLISFSRYLTFYLDFLVI